MWKSHRKNPLMIVKRPQTQGKKMLYLHYQQNIFIATPPSKSPTINDKFRYNDYM